ncbi:hypothetical protein QYF36_007959 [Acer negundo]|nr:hypothetical protein QYF36_007959 [Acer negundo]
MAIDGGEPTRNPLNYFVDCRNLFTHAPQGTRTDETEVAGDDLASRATKKTCAPVHPKHESWWRENRFETKPEGEEDNSLVLPNDLSY